MSLIKFDTSRIGRRWYGGEYAKIHLMLYACIGLFPEQRAKIWQARNNGRGWEDDVQRWWLMSCILNQMCLLTKKKNEKRIRTFKQF